jgi:hypothetical protein
MSDVNTDKLAPITAICGECGAVCDVPVVPGVYEKFEYGAPTCECGAKASGMSWKTGEVRSWTSARELEICRRNMEAMEYDADMNEWYGRGNW